MFDDPKTIFLFDQVPPVQRKSSCHFPSPKKCPVRQKWWQRADRASLYAPEQAKRRAQGGQLEPLREARVDRGNRGLKRHAGGSNRKAAIN